MTEVFLIQQIGLAIGAFAATPLADRYGRQRMIVICLGAFGVVSLLSSLATSLRAFAILRGVAGLFLSGLLPMVVALIAESVPRRRRGTYISVAFVAYSAGSAAGGVVAVWLLERYGWQSVFVVGGAIPLLLVPLVMFVVPESLLFLAEAGAPGERIRAGIGRLDPTAMVPAAAVFQSGLVAENRSRASLAMLFDGEHRMKTFVLWTATFLSMGCIALLAAWLPTLFQEMAGIPIKRFALYSLIGFIGGFAGSLSSGWLLDRTSATTVAPLYYVGLALSLSLLGWLWSASSVFVAAIILYNFFQTGGQAVLNILTSQMYPTGARATGIGWAGGLGRIGGVVLPLLGGLALASHYSIGTTMTMISAIPCGVVIATLVLRGLAAHPGQKFTVTRPP
jgi:AAHS family 4-hydroxybenzoate transporter-like MFS transporter